MSAMGHPTPMSARFLGTGNQPTEANNLSSDALAALVSERLRATRPSRNSSTDSLAGIDSSLGGKQMTDAPTGHGRASPLNIGRGERFARMNSELARAVAAAAAEPSGKLPPSFSLASALSTPGALGLSRSTTPGLLSNYGSCESLAGLAEMHAALNVNSAPTTPALKPSPQIPLTDLLRNFPPAPPNLDEAAAHLADGLRSGLPTCLPTRPRMAAALESPMSAGLFGDEPSTLHGPNKSPREMYPPPRQTLIEGSCPYNQQGAAIPRTYGLTDPLSQSWRTPFTRPPPPPTGTPSISGAASPTHQGTTGASCAPCTLTSLLPTPQLLRPLSPEADDLSPTYHPPAPASISASPTHNRPGGDDKPYHQPINILPGGANPLLPNIGKLSAGCSDGLLLLSSTAFLVARDEDSQAGGTPPCKRPRA